MWIIGYIRASLSTEVCSPERKLLSERAWKVETASVTGSFCNAAFVVASLFLKIGPLSSGACLLAGALLGAALVDTSIMATNVRIMVGADNVWTPLVITRSLFENTQFAGKLFSQRVFNYLRRPTSANEYVGNGC